MSEENQQNLPVTQKKERLIVQAQYDENYSMLMDTARFEQIYRMAQMFSKTDFVPDHYKGKFENCFVAISTAMRMNVDIFMFMNSTYWVRNKLGMYATFIIAMINTRGGLESTLRWEFEGSGNTKKCTCIGIKKGTLEKLEITLTWADVVANGWNSNSAWVKNQEQMFRYRTAAMFARAYCPEVVLGLPAKDELEDMQIEATEATPAPQNNRISSVNNVINSLQVKQENASVDIGQNQLDETSIDNGTDQQRNLEPKDLNQTVGNASGGVESSNKRRPKLDNVAVV